jgi:hypothetical protein
MNNNIDLEGDNLFTGSITNILNELDCEFQIRVIDKREKNKGVEIGDLVVGKDKMGTVFCIHKHEIEIAWRGPLRRYHKVCHKNLFKQKLRIGDWKIYKEVSIHDLNL